MLLTVLALSATIIGATTIAGLLTLYQIRQSSDIANSTKAIYAADAGLEWQLYRFYKNDLVYAKPAFANGADFAITCASRSETVSGQLTEFVTLRSTGNAFKTARAFEMHLERTLSAPANFCQ